MQMAANREKIRLLINGSLQDKSITIINKYIHLILESLNHEHSNKYEKINKKK